MRLSDKYIKVIKQNFEKVFGDGELYVFGSRTDNSKKGGDIDLYIVIDDHNSLFEKKIRFLAGIKRELGEQKIDVIFNTDESRLIEQEAKKWGIRL